MPISKSLAHRIVHAAVRRGNLPRLDGTITCVDCARPAKAYDHRDYDKPLQVEPVCDSCNGWRGPGVNGIDPESIAVKVHLTQKEWLEYKAHCIARDVSIGEDLAEMIREYRLGANGEQNGDSTER